MSSSSESEPESVDEDEDEREEEEEEEDMDEESESEESLVTSLPLSALDPASSSLPACRSSKTPRPRFWKRKKMRRERYRFYFAAHHLYNAFVGFFDVLDIDAPWVSACQFCIGLRDLG